MVGTFYFWILQRTLLLQILKSLASIAETPKIQKYYLQKFNLVMALPQIIFI